MGASIDDIFFINDFLKANFFRWIIKNCNKLKSP